MKKNNLLKEKLFSKGGFYVALFTSTSIVVAIAIGLVFNNLEARNNVNQVVAVDKSNQKELTTQKEAITQKEASTTQKETSTNQKETSTIQKETNANQKDASTNQKDATATQKELFQNSTPIQNVTVTQPEKITVGDTVALASPSEAQEVSLEKTIEPVALDIPVSKEEENSVVEQPTTHVETKNIEPVDEKITEQPQEDLQSLTTFASFSDDQKMSWPLDGEIVMDYSTDSVIYDKTLDQYRTNSSVCIAANVGTQVKASASGVVTSINETQEKGTTVVIEHGNGWKTTYAQLQPNVLVAVGETVEAGDVIGGVANPTRYGILLGGHLDFLVTKDDAAFDPKEILQ